MLPLHYLVPSHRNPESSSYKPHNYSYGSWGGHWLSYLPKVTQIPERGFEPWLQSLKH